MGINSININNSNSSSFSVAVGFNSLSTAVKTAKGYFTLDGDFYNGPMLISGRNTITDEEYTYYSTGGYFTIYFYVDSVGSIVPTVISGRGANYKGFLEVSAEGVYAIPLEEAYSMAVKGSYSFLPNLETVNTNNFVYDGECCYKERVFALPGGEWWQNDKSSALLKKLQPADTIFFILRKDGEDTTYEGTRYSFTLYEGILIDWEEVYTLFGAGSYQLYAETVIAGVPGEWFSQTYCLSLFDDLKADNTVRIETYQTGSLIRSGYNYDELGLENGWYQSVRIDAKFWNKRPTLEQDYIMASDRRMIQVQDTLVYEYDMETNLLPSSAAVPIIEDNLLANRILITDYSLFNSEIFRRIEVYPTAIEPVHYSFNKNSIYRVTFTDRFKNLLKRNN